LDLKDTGLRLLRPIDRLGYQVTARLFYPVNTLLARLFHDRRGKGVLHISTVTHQPYIITRHLRAQGFDADFLAIGEGWLSYNEEGWDFHLRRIPVPGPLRFIYEFWWAWKLYPRYQLVHSHFLQLIGSGWELKFLKMMGKKVVFHFRGDDIRRKEINLQLNPELNCCQECDYPHDYCHDPQRYSLADLARKYGDLSLVTTPDLNDFLPDAIHFPFMIPELPGQMPIPFEERQYSEKITKILHVTNHEGIDGTQHIVKVVSQLKEEGYPIDLIMPRKVPFQEMLKIQSQADLSVGKLMMGYYANAQIESMYFGVPTMCYIREDFLKKIPDCPIINVRPENLYQRLKYYLDHRDELLEIGKRGTEFVRKYHSGNVLAKRLIDMYRSC
jgi:glycosyltransferase involved in cell wall biosynthesis